MNIQIAALSDLSEIHKLVETTIKNIYPKYYDKKIVEFFLKLHNRENIAIDIENNRTYILADNNKIIGTGSFLENHISRVFILPEYQNQGYGSKIMDFLESKIRLNYTYAVLESSIPSKEFYKNRNYVKLDEERLFIDDDFYFSFDVLEKNFN